MQIMSEISFVSMYKHHNTHKSKEKTRIMLSFDENLKNSPTTMVDMVALRSSSDKGPNTLPVQFFL